jgi:murein L,D-transpeptidase YcbB/YkuD
VRQLRVRLGLPAGETYDEPLEGAVRRFQGAHGLAATGEADAATVAALNAGAAHYQALIAANLERARALPPLKGRRYILVNVAARELTYHQDGQADGTMRIIAGARTEPTPMMAGLITHLMFNPFWEIPQDMVRGSIAPKMLRLGAGEAKALRLQVLSDWGEAPVEVDPARIDWQSVADGGLELRVRQRPGGDNMMGRVKFMLPNELGIYLHDTPDKAAFGGPSRLLSAGCVRLEQAPQLAACCWAARRRTRVGPATSGSTWTRRRRSTSPT